MDHHDPIRRGLDGSSEPEYFQLRPPFSLPAGDGFQPEVDDVVEHSLPLPTTPLEHPSSPNSLSANPGYISTPYASWTTVPAMQTRPRGGSSAGSAASRDPPNAADMTALADRDRRPPQRPSMPTRTPSSTYDPPRRPPQFINVHSSSNLALTAKRASRRDPNAQYRAQEKAYVQRVRQGLAAEWIPFATQSPLLDTEGESEPDDESPGSEIQLSSDPFDFDANIYEDEEIQPTLEDLQDPKIREKLEWHSMLASVLKGDVVRQEKQRLIGTAQQMNIEALLKEIWFGVRARKFGRTVAMQKKIVDHGRAALWTMVEEIIAFEIQGEAEAGPPLRQVENVVAKIEKVQDLYASSRELEAANTRAASDEFHSSCSAIIAWHNTTLLINTQLTVLKKWVGNDVLDFCWRGDKELAGAMELANEGTFLDRLLKEEGLKSIQGEKGILSRLGEVINKAKSTLIENSETFAKRHLPPYIEELLTLINFPSRLIQEVIRIRISYAKKMKDPGQQSTILVEQMIVQFQILMRLAVDIKLRYLEISAPEPGWDLPPCVDENFDVVIVDSLKFYFRLLNWKLAVNKNTFKEAEILESEWDFLNGVGRELEGGDIEVAEQFRYVRSSFALRAFANALITVA